MKIYKSVKNESKSPALIIAKRLVFLTSFTWKQFTATTQLVFWEFGELTQRSSQFEGKRPSDRAKKHESKKSEVQEGWQ